ncbi:MAG: hypothetical protein RLZZ618_2312 [Pseudomonadota bacterium]
MLKLKMHSPDLTQTQIAKLRDLFPGCVTEAQGTAGEIRLAVDFDALRQELSGQLVEGPQERYQMSWPGKREALLIANSPIAKTLRPCREESVDFDATHNLFVEGDNLDALKLLQETYLGKVKMIYIDPPYNTGGDFIYKDDFSESADGFLKKSNQVDEDGNRMIANTEANGRFHSEWLSMMYSRVRLARNLLRDDGVIFISIDDNEFCNAKKICDEVFGEENSVGMFSVENNPKGRKNGKFISVTNEYCLIYSKQVEAACFRKIVPKHADDMSEDENGDFVRRSGKRVLMGENSLNNSVTNFKSPKHYSAYIKDSDLILKKEKGIREIDLDLLGNGYVRYITFKGDIFVENTYSDEKFKELFSEKSLDIREEKIYEKHFSDMMQIKSMLVNDGYEAIVENKKVAYQIDLKSTSAKKQLIDLMGGDYFSFPKNISFIKSLLSLTSAPDSNEIFLDFFSGSGTTAHAVMQLNSEDGGNRRFIVVQLPELCAEGSESVKAGFKTIAEVSKERIRRAGLKIKHENALFGDSLDIGFRVLKIATSNMADVYYAPDATDKANLDLFVNNIKTDRTHEDLLFQVMLDWGIDLALPIAKETIQGREIFLVDGNVLAACFDTSGRVDEAFVKELAKHQPLRAVFRDAGFKDSAVKINVEQIFKLLSPGTEVKCI